MSNYSAVSFALSSINSGMGVAAVFIGLATGNPIISGLGVGFTVVNSIGAYSLSK